MESVLLDSFITLVCNVVLCKEQLCVSQMIYNFKIGGIWQYNKICDKIAIRYGFLKSEIIAGYIVIITISRSLTLNLSLI